MRIGVEAQRPPGNLAPLLIAFEPEAGVRHADPGADAQGIERTKPDHVVETLDCAFGLTAHQRDPAARIPGESEIGVQRDRLLDHRRAEVVVMPEICLLYTSPSPRDS